MARTVKAREHYGADSLDLTIPSKLVRKHDVNPGDIFEIDHEVDDGELIVRYRRVYESE
jgi:hypothetical protein